MAETRPLDILILASSSPRRHELLNQMGVPHEVISPDVNEAAFSDDDPAALVRTLAAEKARAVRATVAGTSERWILAADTIVAVSGHNLGKPADREEAGAMIRQLSGRTHLVVTGIALWPPRAAEPDVRVASTSVSFAKLGPDEVERYLNTGDWRGAAGAYRIQGRAGLHIESIHGSYANVVGLPIHLVYSIFTQHGYQGA